MADFTIVSGDTTPPLTATLTVDGVAQDLTGAAVDLILLNQTGSSTYLTAACTVTDAVNGAISYTWMPSDTAIAGEYVAQFQVTFSDTSTRFFPTEGYFTVAITPQLTGNIKPRPDYVTTADIIRWTRRLLEGKERSNRNKLAGQVGTTDTSLTFTYTLSAAAAGLPLSIGLETLYVWQASGSTVTVERGTDGTIPSQHAAGDIVLIDPEFTDGAILDAINTTLAALPSAGVYRVQSLDRTLLPSSQGYDLAQDVVDVLDVRWQDLYDATQWTPVPSFDVQQNMPTDVFPSGTALFIPEPPQRTWIVNGNTEQGFRLRIRYRTDFTPLTSLFDDVITTTGLPSTAADLLSIGAALRLMDGRPIPRVFNLAQPDPRNAAEVNAQMVVNAPAALRARWQQRVTDEANKLGREWRMREPARTLMGGWGRRPTRRWWGY